MAGMDYKACPRCIEQGREWYENGDRSHYRHIFLQDRVADRYSERKD
jgi:hypothetical protein